MEIVFSCGEWKKSELKLMALTPISRSSLKFPRGLESDVRILASDIWGKLLIRK